MIKVLKLLINDKNIPKNSYCSISLLDHTEFLKPS